ncbi:MAG: hypothetical protein HYX76_08415, partial [Acidobacteria bacterium]|nr:hypothetical protein [Acidobacteriota bacterium]
PDGYNPLGSLTEGGDGSFYGTMANGGPFGRGVVFRFNPATSAFAVLHAFSNGADGGEPLAGMIEASDGNLYGTTSTGGPGAGAAGTVFRLAPDAVLETVFAFNTASAPLNGHTPQAPLIEASPVSFYGTASGGGEARSGVVFNLSFVTGPLALTSPNGGEKLFTGTPYRIDWTSSLGGIASFDLFYSTNGTTYSPIAGCSGLSSAARSCPWTSPGPVSSTVTVKVVATDGIGDQTSDASDAVFSIVSGTASITVTYPNTSSVSWAIGTIQQIKWNHNLAAGTLVKLELSRNGGTTYDEVIAASVPCTGATNSIYNWPVTGPATKTARVRVTWTNASTSDASNNSFKIGAGFVKVQAPKAGTNIGYNTSQKQTWTSNLGALDTVDVLLSTDNGVTFPIVLASGILASKKSVTYTMPDIGTPTTQARIKVVWSNPPAGSAAAGTSPMFSVQPPFVTAVAPNGGEIWSIGSKPTVQWSSNLGALERVRLELSQDDGGTYSITMISSTPSDGKQAVSVVGGWATQTARVRIVWLKDAPVADPSNASFKIQ